MGMFRVLRRGAAVVALGAAAGAVVVTARHLLETPQPLESLLPGEERIDRDHGGDIYYNVAGRQDAPPLLLLHDFYPGASNFEFRRVFGPLAERYRVYAPDWLGYGMSEHPNIAYTGEFYAGVLTGYLRDVIAKPATVLAHGRAANIAVRAASDTPALFERLILVSPYAEADVALEPTLAQVAARATQRTALGLVPYALLATKPVLRWLSNGRGAAVGAGAGSRENVDHLYASAHQFGGQYALLPVLTGELDLPVRNAFQLLEPPVLIISGERDPRRAREAMEDLAVLNPRADLDVIAGAGEAVFEDRPDAFVSAIQQWLSAPAGRNLLDESALLPPLDMPEPSEPAEPAEPVVGEPGYVVPGVSDMGLDGPAAVTTSATSSGTAGAEAPLLGPAAEVGGGIVNTQDETIAAELPEAGEASPEEPADRAAREGVSPPLEPADNIAEVTAAGEGIAAAHARGEPEERGDVAGLAETVQTPDTAVATPADVATSESAVETVDAAVETPATTGRTDAVVPASEEPPEALGEQPTMPLPRVRPAGGAQRSQQSQRSAPRSPSPRTEGGSRGTGTNTARSSRGQSGGRSGGASSGGSKRGHGRKSGH